MNHLAEKLRDGFKESKVIAKTIRVIRAKNSCNKLKPPWIEKLKEKDGVKNGS